MRKTQRALLAGSLGLAASLVAGCGSGAGLLTGNQAGTLQNQLTQISSAFSAGQCGTVRRGTQALVHEVASLPATVNDSLRKALDGEASQVSRLAVEQCHAVSATTTPTTPTTPTNTNTTTTPTTNTNTTTTPTTNTNTSTTTTPTTPTNPATTPSTTGTNSGGGGLGGGAGGGANPGTTNPNGNGNG